MKALPLTRRTLALAAVLVPLLALFVYVALRSGPLAPVPVTVAAVEVRSITPAISGIGIVEARYTYKIGPTAPGRVKRVDVSVGDRVRAGQVLGEMDPVDLDYALESRKAALKRSEAAVAAARAQVGEAEARQAYAASQSKRYEELLRTGSVTVVAAEGKVQEKRVAEAMVAAAAANLEAAKEELGRARAEVEAAGKQRANLRLVAPVAGLVAFRGADPGTTVVAGEAVVEIIDPKSVWVNARFNQLGTSGLAAGLPAQIVLRSQSGRAIPGRIERIEPLADAVTEETLAKAVFADAAGAATLVGELAEVTVALPALEASPVVPSASVQRVDGRTGVWVMDGGSLRFAPAVIGAADLDGFVQVHDGLSPGDRVVVYSHKALNERSRVKIVESLPGTEKR